MFSEDSSVPVPLLPYSLFLSDLHLSPHSPLSALAVSFWRSSLCRQAQSIYILGDLFDAWIGDPLCMQPLWIEVTEALSQLSAHVPVWVMHGNRDFLLGTYFARCTGVHLVTKDYCIFQGHGRRILLLHGDTLCTADRQYQYFRYVMRYGLKPIISLLPFGARERLAHFLRSRSRYSTQKKSLVIQDVSPQALWPLYEQYAVQTMIHGHTHRPRYHSYARDSMTTYHRWVLPDWRSTEDGVRAAVLCVDAQEIRFLSISGKMSD